MERTKARYPKHQNSSPRQALSNQFHKRTISFSYLEDRVSQNKRMLKARESSKKSMQITGHKYSNSHTDSPSCIYLQNSFCDYSPLIFPCFNSVSTSFKLANHSTGDLRQDLFSQPGHIKPNVNPLIITPYKITESDVKVPNDKLIRNNLSIKVAGLKQHVNNRFGSDSSSIFSSFDEKIHGNKLLINSHKDYYDYDEAQESKPKTAKCAIRIELPSTSSLGESVEGKFPNKLAEKRQSCPSLTPLIDETISDIRKSARLSNNHPRSRFESLERDKKVFKSPVGRNSSIDDKLETPKETPKHSSRFKYRFRKSIVFSKSIKKIKPVRPKTAEESPHLSNLRRASNPVRELFQVKSIVTRKKRGSMGSGNSRPLDKTMNQSWEWSSYEDSRLC
jgi:hypothetical protein